LAKVLIVDDDPSNRAILTRMLRSVSDDVAIAEAANGLEALDALTRGGVSLVLLDARMPVLDGVETLEAIRKSPELAALPVCMLTADRKEALVLRALELGVADFMLKPLNPRITLPRLQRLLDESREFVAPTRRAFSMENGSRALIVDDSDDFRRFFSEEVGRRYTVCQAKTGVEALQMCLRMPPDAAFLSERIGLLERDTLAHKIRALEGCQTSLLIAIAADEGCHKEAVQEPFDGVLVRSFDPDTFWSRFRLAVRADDIALLTSGSPIVDATVMALRQACGLILDLDVQAATPQPDRLRRAWRGLQIDLSGPETTIVIEYAMPVTVVRGQLGVHAGGRSPYAFGEQEVGEAVREIAMTAAGRLVAMLNARGTSVEIRATRTMAPADIRYGHGHENAPGVFHTAFVSSGASCATLTLRYEDSLTSVRRSSTAQAPATR
jgi:two-component system chemotaxis response regulator CheY